MSVYYGNTFYNSRDLQREAKLYVKNLPKDVTHLICRGSSGCAIASAIMMLYKGGEDGLKCLVLRKSTENTHSGGTVGYIPYHSHGKDVVCFVDDFISTGETLNRVLMWANENGVKIKYALVDRNSAVGVRFDGIEIVTLGSFLRGILYMGTGKNKLAEFILGLVTIGIAFTVVVWVFGLIQG